MHLAKAIYIAFNISVCSIHTLTANQMCKVEQQAKGELYTQMHLNTNPRLRVFRSHCPIKRLAW